MKKEPPPELNWSVQPGDAHRNDSLNTLRCGGCGKTVHPGGGKPRAACCNGVESYPSSDRGRKGAGSNVEFSQHMTGD
eukprot:2915356-Amphidinium_carterae.2